jgi:uncharacterized coiled-coil protein SlyX
LTDLFSWLKGLPLVGEHFKNFGDWLGGVGEGAGVAFAGAQAGLSGLVNEAKEGFPAIQDFMKEMLGLKQEEPFIGPEYSGPMPELPPMPDLGDTEKGAKAAAASVQELVSAMVSLHPATAAAAADVAMWESRIADVNLAIQANQDQLKAAQAEYSRMSDKLSELNEKLSAAKQRFTDLQNVQFTGEGAAGEAIAQLQHQLLGLNIQKEKLLPGMDSTALDKQITDMQAKLKLMQDEYAYTFDEMRRKLQQAAEGPQKEMSFDAAMSALSKTRGEIDSLTRSVSAQEAAMKAQQAVINGIQAAGEALNRTLQGYQTQLDGAKTKQDLMTQALTAAYTWLFEDRTKFTELGAEGERVAGVMDIKARELLAAVSGAAGDTATISTDTLTAMVANYNTSMDQAKLAVAGVQGALDAIPRDIYTYHHTIMLPPESGGAGIVGQNASGTDYWRGGLTWVGERGPELVNLPTGSRVYNNSESRGMAGGIDYDALAAALARQPIVVTIDGQRVMTAVRDEYHRGPGRAGVAF